MKIMVIGASGMAGREIINEGLNRGHEMVGVVRHTSKAREVLGDTIKLIEKDAFDLTHSELQNFNVVVNAFATAPETAYLHVDLAAHLVAQLRETEKPRLFFILGAGSLLQADGTLTLEKIRILPNAAAWIAVPEAALWELNFLRDVHNVDWVGVSPSFSFVPGPKTAYLTGKDHLLFNKQKESVVNSKTMAVAILDEIEDPKHIRERFTVVNDD